tara:strand:+ start:215 stop:448 length:234 start_codon:yes stop_codon:yes gene_type:complete
MNNPEDECEITLKREHLKKKLNTKIRDKRQRKPELTRSTSDEINDTMSNMSQNDIMSIFNKIKDEPSFSELLKKLST